MSNYDHVFGGPIAETQFEITGDMPLSTRNPIAGNGLVVTGPTQMALLAPRNSKPLLRLFINEQGQVDAEYDNLSDAAQALIDEVRSKWVDATKLKP